uniref:NADH dehydrogenase subunit 4L n=1 Tax=Phaedusa dichroa TaxID=1885796 RepID=A0A224AAV2_9EUPU|nr:NADH dehydrogenase subunit 4L [Phaedusa dichroa]
MFIMSVLSLIMFTMILLFFLIYKHLLSALLILETIMLTDLILMILLTLVMMGNVDFYRMVLSFAVGEAASGLAILSSLIKTKGNDLISVSHS